MLSWWGWCQNVCHPPISEFRFHLEPKLHLEPGVNHWPMSESDSITYHTEQTILNLRKSRNSNIILPTIHPNYCVDDEESIDNDECTDLTELYELYKDHTTKYQNHDSTSSSTNNASSLNQLLQLYLPKPWCLELGAGDLSERTQLEELEEDVHFVFRWKLWAYFMLKSDL